MQTKPLLYGLIGFFIGGFIVAVAATTFDKPSEQVASKNDMSVDNMSMSEMTESLAGKTGDDYDAEFISSMIEHHEGAVDMAKLSANNARHDEIKQLSLDIIEAQQKEITEMKQWQKNWGYITDTGHGTMGH